MNCCFIYSLDFSWHEPTSSWKRFPFYAGRGELFGKRKRQSIIRQMAWTTPFLLTFALIPGFPSCSCLSSAVVLWGYKGGMKSGVLSLSSLPFFWAVPVLSRRVSGEGVLCSAYSACLHGPPGLLLLKASFQQRHGIMESFGLDLRSSSSSTPSAAFRDIFQ